MVKVVATKTCVVNNTKYQSGDVFEVPRSGAEMLTSSSGKGKCAAYYYRHDKFEWEFLRPLNNAWSE